jgi:hypothetical protein
VQAWIAANNVQVMEHPPYSPDLALVDYFLFRRVKEGMAGIRLTPEILKKTWDGVMKAISIERFGKALRCWPDLCNKCIWLNSRYVKKS